MLKPETYKEARLEDYSTVSGRVRLTYIPSAVNVSVLAENRTVGSVETHVAISAAESEVLVNDRLADELKISIIKAGVGEWRFIDDDPKKIRSV